MNRRGVVKWMAAGGAVVVAAAGAICAQAAYSDQTLKAMHDEAMRSLTLAVASLEKPYFVEYVLDQEEVFTVSATLGGLMVRNREQLREPEVHVRVGDYKFDNGNFAGAGFGGRFRGHLPLEGSYDLARRFFWLATDAAYKGAVEGIARKRAALRNVSESGDRLDDFGRVAPLRAVRELGHLSLDEDAWAARVRSLSAVFAGYPAVKDSRVDLEANAGGYYVVNSEGTEVRMPEDVTFLRMRAMAQSADGSAVRDLASFHALETAGMPGEAELMAGARELAARVTALAAAPKGEDYTGPVLFEGTAGAQLLAEVVGRNVILARKPEGGRGGAFLASEYQGRVGSRVLPESFDVVDDPTQKQWRGRPLFGAYEVDREGVAAQPVSLIEKGVLKTFLLTRQPLKGMPGSNGHGRLPGAYGASEAGIGNLFVRSSEASPAGGLKRKLIEAIQARGKPYGILVRKLDFPSSAPLDEVRRLLSETSGMAQPVSAPVLTYKVYPDGREELIRGVEFKGLNARSLKDILAAGDDANVFEYMDNGGPLAVLGAGSFTIEACVVAPSVLIDDLELRPVEEELPKLPVVPAPELITPEPVK
ncbi:MAG: metallopeptidase TldD-related protein [Bryobacteraceae bacterium]